MGLLEDLGFFASLAWYLVLGYIALWLYNWTREKLGFSQVLTFAVAGILVYFLVIEHPLVGAIGVFGWILLTGGLLLVLGMIPSVYMMFRPKH